MHYVVYRKIDHVLRLTLDLIVNKDTWTIEKSSSFKNTCICIRKNLRYDTYEQRTDKTLSNNTLHYVKKMNKEKRYIDNVVNCHDLIAYLMILMNYISAIYLERK